MSGKIKIRPILIAFSGDKEIDQFCDPNNPDKTDSGVAVDTFHKLVAWADTVHGGIFTEVTNYDKVVGFVYTVPGRLVSFGVNPKYRTKKVLSGVFEYVLDTIGNEFSASMWTRNERAIKWLERCGMEVEYSDDEVTELIYKKCQ